MPAEVGEDPPNPMATQPKKEAQEMHPPQGPSGLGTQHPHGKVAAPPWNSILSQSPPPEYHIVNPLKSINPSC